MLVFSKANQEQEEEEEEVENPACGERPKPRSNRVVCEVITLILIAFE